MLLPLVLAVTLLAQAQGTPSSQLKAEGGSPAAKPAAQPINLESYQLVLLQRPEHPREYAEDKLEEIQQAHLAHLGQLAKSGKLMVAGPLGDQPDPRCLPAVRPVRRDAATDRPNARPARGRFAGTTGDLRRRHSGHHQCSGCNHCLLLLWVIGKGTDQATEDRTG